MMQDRGLEVFKNKKQTLTHSLLPRLTALESLVQ